MPQYLIGTGGWAYFQVPGKSPLSAYSQVFNFVEVNSTFYEYPSLSTVEKWRRTVPTDFVFSVRCHQDLTHRIGLISTNGAFEVFHKMKAYCGVLESPYLVLETSASQTFDKIAINDAKGFFSSVSNSGLQLIWEFRAPFTQEVSRLMQDFGIIQSVDLSVQRPRLYSDLAYSRLFGKGKHNVWQFTDGELVEIERNADETGAKKVILAYHGSRMNTDAIRSKTHIMTGAFLPATNSTGTGSVQTVLSEDASFPSSKAELIADQGWKVVDLTVDKRVHLSDVLAKIPEKTYHSLDEVVKEVKAVV